MPEPEACRIVILLKAPGVVDVAAPMKHKHLCYDILKSAKAVIESTRSELFTSLLDKDARLVIVMDMKGTVDVAAPLPSRELCYLMLKDAKVVIEKYDDAAQIPTRAFSGRILGE